MRLNEKLLNRRFGLFLLPVVVFLVGDAELFAASVPTISTRRTVRVVRVRYQPVGACLGVDDTITPVAVIAPIGGSNNARATIAPVTQATRVQFNSANAAIATVNPAVAAASPQDLQIGGVSHDETLIRARTATSGILQSMTASAKPRLDRTLAIHAITEQNDDVQAVPVGQGEPNQTCVTAGANGTINTTPQGDDVLVGTTMIHTGPNGICNSTASGDDVQVILAGQGRPNRPCVAQGTNAFRDSVPVGDDQITGNDINSGANGICQTIASATNLVPTDVPTAAALQTHLNAVWGQQANVFFTVTRTDAILNYDLDRDGQLADPFDFASTTEVDVLSGAAAGKDYNVFYVRNYSHPVALAIRARREAWVGDAKSGTAVYATAHEMGHLLGRPGHSADPLDLMFPADNGTNPCEVRRFDWNLVNP